jgi:acylphosphatase
MFECPSQAVHQVVDWCWQGSPSAKVSDVKIEWQEFAGEYDSFSITY